ncbi:MAG: DUF4287 domain-containing protein [Planctomycetes bacterium]|nr:DUF4287 domain-containing protein [Planctomycetota bacterium]MBI3834709.1 DUF4287 domain-containing protein [Planctomycetota bacterium]
MAVAKTAKKISDIYSVHPGVQMVHDWVDRLKAKTGRTLEEWVRLVKKDGPKSEALRRDWLRKEHGFGTNAAWWLAEWTKGKGTEDSDPELYLKAAAEYVETMYSGNKAGLRPIHDELIRMAQKLGKDVRICPCKTIVPLYRNQVFAEIKPSTKTRIDFGFAFGDMKARGRLVDTGGFAKKDRITHRIPITNLDEIDGEVWKWLREAYDRDGKQTLRGSVNKASG